MKLEVGMYVRTKKGEIDKILHIDYADERRKKYPTHPSNKYWRDKMLLEHKGYRVTNQSITKASHNIIDLIEVGDYVNGYQVIEEPYNYHDIKFISVDTQDSWSWGKGEMPSTEIKSILTKEQFENNCYKIGDE